MSLRCSRRRASRRRRARTAPSSQQVGPAAGLRRQGDRPPAGEQQQPGADRPVEPRQPRIGPPAGRHQPVDPVRRLNVGWRCSYWWQCRCLSACDGQLGTQSLRRAQSRSSQRDRSEPPRMSARRRMACTSRRRREPDGARRSAHDPRLYVERPLAAGAVVAADDRARTTCATCCGSRPAMRWRCSTAATASRARIAALDKRKAELKARGCARAQDRVPDLWLLLRPDQEGRASTSWSRRRPSLASRRCSRCSRGDTVASRINLERLRANAIEAAEQTERLTVPEVRAPVTLRRAGIAAGDRPGI